MNLKKRLLVSALAATLLAPAALATVENTTGNTITASAAKAKHHKKTKKAKKHAKKKTAKKEPKQTTTNQTTTQPTQTTTTQQPDDYQTYNDAVSSLGQYANPGNLTSFKVGAGTRFATGSRQDIVNSLNDMTANMGSSDAYDLRMYGNPADIAFQQQAVVLYNSFKDRFSSYDNTQLTNDINTIQQHWISPSSTYDDANTQWINLTNFMNDLSNAFRKLGN